MQTQTLEISRDAFGLHQTQNRIAPHWAPISITLMSFYSVFAFFDCVWPVFFAPLMSVLVAAQ